MVVLSVDQMDRWWAAYSVVQLVVLMADLKVSSSVVSLVVRWVVLSVETMVDQ